ncbi:tRNA uracil 4-sulfurtransferase ThiI [Culicoidibacter larvae]|uniref:Probable tRNA sulfurtransferase n=1 Tax=Culicoidibacter larvae TaxID=2579976 RepID=A0A5R8QC55_9FIRM|nr:tRNA uracil 4-sulfurtransferase ThiI [Culicoidibacter larvae]TLG72908.1 tRNA 4-thiouridine(8) synthase ThiI [Culicoidibacter larvae]
MTYDYTHVLIRYGELMTKGKNRKTFIGRLQENVRAALLPFPEVTLETAHDRMYVVLNGTQSEAVCESLQKVFGIHSMSLAIKVATDEAAIMAAALWAIEQLDISTFKAEVKRSFKQFPILSTDFARMVGGHVLRNTENITVDVHNPDVTLLVEVREAFTYVMCGVLQGAGGYPVGVAGKGMLMISGGIDSPVAGFLATKRGVMLEAVHFESPPYTNAQAKQKVIDLLHQLTDYTPYVTTHIVPFTQLQVAINRFVDEKYQMTVMRRMMYRIAQWLAYRRRCEILVNGENIGQVASQTLHSMKVINSVVSIPVIRPVATYDKNEIIDIAKKIGTYDISIRPFEDCCTIFTPKHPATMPKEKFVLEQEARFDWEPLVEACVRNTERIVIDKTYSKLSDDELDLF